MHGLFDNEGVAPPSPARKRPGPKPKQKQMAELDIKVALKASGNIKEFTVQLNDDWTELLDWYSGRRHDSPAAVITAGLRAYLIPMRERRAEVEERLREVEKEEMDKLFGKVAAVDAEPGTSI